MGFYEEGSGVQQQKRQRTSCNFPGGMIFFVLRLRTFSQSNPLKTTENVIKKTKDMFFYVLFWDTYLITFGTKKSILNVFWKKTKKSKRQKTSRVFPAA